MKRVIEIVVRVEVVCDNEKDIKHAMKDLRENPPLVERTVSGYDGPRDRRGFACDFSGKYDFCFSARSKGVVSMRVLK